MVTPYRFRCGPRFPLALLLALTLLACTGDEELPDEFDAGPIDNFPPQSVVTFADRVEIERATSEGSTGDHLFGGHLVFHLVRLQSGDFLALSARDPHSDCWIVWYPELDPMEVTIEPAWPGWFRDPCHGAIYDEHGTRVFGPAPRNLDHYPVELRDGHVYVTLTEDALILGQKPPGSDSTSTPTPTMTPQPTPTPGTIPTPAPISPSAVASSTDVATATATAVATVTPPPTPTSLPLSDGGFAPTDGTPWTAADYLAALEEQNIHVAPTDRTFACAEVSGVTAAEYDGDAHFILWVYPTPEAAAAEWVVYSFGARHPVLSCNLAPTRLYANDNVVLWISAATGFPAISIRVGETLLGLGSSGAPLPSDINQFALVPPAEGIPLAAADLLDTLLALDLYYAPYEQPACPYGSSAAKLQWMGGPEPGEGPPGAGFQLWVFPTVAALEAEWELGVDGPLGQLGSHHSRYSDCDYGGSIYHNANMLLMFGGGVWNEELDYKATIVDAFLSLQP